VHERHDVHVLGYGFDVEARDLARFLADQRHDRMRRVHEMAARLAAIGVPIDVQPLLARVRDRDGWAVGRPQVALALVDAGHVDTVIDAFERFLCEDGPAFVPRRGVTPAEVVEVVHRAGGVASLAHPGDTRVDAIIPSLARAGLDAIEAYHSSHDAETTARYLAVAACEGLAVSGGSDFHGPRASGPIAPGSVCLPDESYGRLRARAPAGGGWQVADGRLPGCDRRALHVRATWLTSSERARMPESRADRRCPPSSKSPAS